MKDFASMFGKPTGELRELLALATAMTDKIAQNDFTTSFAIQLEITAKVLRNSNMPQSTINMCLASRCGVPFEPVDTKSMYVQWIEDEPRVEQ